MKRKEKPDGWLINHMLSVFVWNFNYDARDFWWGKDDPWSRHEIVSFRFLKIYVAEFWAMLLKWILLGVAVFLISKVRSPERDDFIFTGIMVAVIFLIGSFMLTILAWLRVKKGVYDVKD